jgi:hypothetical protein
MGQGQGQSSIERTGPVSHIRVLICQVDELEQMTELATFDLSGSESVRLEAGHTLDDLESQTQRIGNRILCHVLQAQWDLIDAHLTEQYIQQMAPATIQRDGQEGLRQESEHDVQPGGSRAKAMGKGQSDSKSRPNGIR